MRHLILSVILASIVVFAGQNLPVRRDLRLTLVDREGHRTLVGLRSSLRDSHLRPTRVSLRSTRV